MAKKKNLPKKTVYQQVDELLKAVPENELRAFIHKKALHERPFREELTNAFAHILEKESKAMYAKQVRGMLSSARRRGYVDANDSGKLNRSLEPMLAKAETHAKQGNIQSALWISSAVLEELTKTINYVDDSRGFLGHFIDQSYALLLGFRKLAMNDSQRRQVFIYATKTYKKNVFEGWDWHQGILSLAVGLVKTDSEIKSLQKIINDLQTEVDEYELSEALTLKLELLKKTGSTEEVENFIKKNLSSSKIRNATIEDLFNQKAYDKAKALANEGIKTCPKDLHGLKSQWEDWLLKIALKEEDTETILRLANHLLLHNINEPLEYYDLIKKYTPTKQWEIVFAEIIAAINRKNHSIYIQMIANIYVKEQKWDELLAFLDKKLQSNEINIEYIRIYEKYLIPKYSTDIARMYELGVLLSLETKATSNIYSRACWYIKNMIKLGATKQANNLIKNLYKLYPNRPALLRELDKLA